jgi:hypothetical protein
MGQIVGSRFSRIAAPVVGLLAVLAAVGFVLAAPRLLDSSRDQAAIPAPPAGTGEVASVVAPPLETPGPVHPAGRTPPIGSTETSAPSGASAAPPAPSTPAADPGIAPNERPSGGGISATPQPGVGQGPDQDDGHGRSAKDTAHGTHHGHGNGHEHHGNGQGVGHSGDGSGDRHDHGKHSGGKHNGWTKPEKDPPPKPDHSLGSGHGSSTKSGGEHGQGAQHGKSGGRAHSHARSRR